MMNKEEIKNRIEYLRKQVPDKKLAIEKSIRELKSMVEEISKLELKLNELNG